MPQARSSLSVAPSPAAASPWGAASRVLLPLAGCLVVAALVWQAVTAGGEPDPLAAGRGSTAAMLDIGVLVFREGLECILVLAAITASMKGASERYRRPVAVGVAVGIVATLLTWRAAVGVIGALLQNVPALQIQAATGLLAIVVLLVVMNWFFHKLYWTGWISLHTRRKKTLMERAAGPGASRTRLLWGLALLGFTSFYREGFEVVLFLQSYRLKLGSATVSSGVAAGVALTCIAAVLTFVANRRLPYRKMLVATGVLLGFVLLVMVGEQAQEMQLAHWLPTTPIPSLSHLMPGWMGIWFGLSPTVETLAAQAIAAVLVLGSYAWVRFQLSQHVRRPERGPAMRSQAHYG